MELSSDASKLTAMMYKEYLERRKSGMDKLNAKHFSFAEISSLKVCLPWSASDIKATTAEIHHAGFGTMFYDCGFLANDKFIIYMENRFKNGLLEVLDFITKFIP